MSEAKSRLSRKLVEVAEAIQGVNFLRGFLFSFAVFGAAVLLAALADNILHLPSWLRGVGFFLLVGLGVYLFLWRVVAVVLRRPDDEEAAIAAERRYPEAENLLINAVQLSKRRFDGLTRLMAERVLEEAAQFVVRVEPREVAPRRLVRRVGFAAGIVAAVFALYLIVAPSHLGNALNRYILFRSDIPPITATKISVEPGDCRVLWGEPLTITASVKSDTPCEARIRIGKGEPTLMRFDGTRFTYTVSAVRSPFFYTVAAGDAVAGPFRVDVVYRPTIQRADVTFVYPAYSRLPSQTVRGADLNFKIVGGTEIDMTIHTMQKLKEAFLLVYGKKMEGSVDGRTVRWRFTPEKSSSYRIHLADGEGNICRYTYNITVKKDAPPRVRLLSPRRDLTLLVETASDIHLLAEAEDDLALISLGFEIEGPDGRRVLRRGFADGGRRPPQRTHITHTVVLSDASAGDVWRIRAFATDGRDGVVARSGWVKVRLVSAEEQMRMSRRRLEDLRKKIERLLKIQIKIHNGTVRRKNFARLATAQGSLRKQTLRVADFEPISLWEGRVRSVLRAVADGCMLKAQEALLAALKDHRALTVAINSQTESISKLRQLLSDIAQMLVKLTKTDHQIKALKERTKMIRFWEEVKKGLESFIKEQKGVVQAGEQLRKKGVEDWTEGDELVCDKQKEIESKWEKYFEDKKADLSRLPEQDFSDSTQRKELIEIYEEVKLAKDAFTRREVEIAVPTARGAMEKAENLVENIERWLSDVRDNIKWVMEEPPEQQEIPLAELPDELEDIIGDLIDREDELGEEVEDVSSAWAGSFDLGAGWTGMDGPISNMSAKGITGNLMPNRSEIGGRSGEGRMGRCHGQFVEQEATGKGGRQTPTRLTPDPYEGGSVKDSSGQSAGGATGGGKVSGGGEEGLRGPVPPELRQRLRRLASKQALIAERAERLARSLKRRGVPCDAATAAALSMRNAADALLNAASSNISKNLYRFFQEKRKIVSSLIQQGRIINALRTEAEILQRLPKELREEILSAQKEPQPEKFREILRAYYHNLAHQK